MSLIKNTACMRSEGDLVKSFAHTDVTDNAGNTPLSLANGNQDI